MHLRIKLNYRGEQEGFLLLSVPVFALPLNAYLNSACWANEHDVISKSRQTRIRLPIMPRLTSNHQDQMNPGEKSNGNTVLPAVTRIPFGSGHEILICLWVGSSRKKGLGWTVSMADHKAMCCKVSSLGLARSSQALAARAGGGGGGDPSLANWVVLCCLFLCQIVKRFEGIWLNEQWMLLKRQARRLGLSGLLFILFSCYRISSGATELS